MSHARATLGIHFALAFGAFALGCSGSNGTGEPAPADTGAPDTTIADEGVDTADTTPVDTGDEVADATDAADAYDGNPGWPTCDAQPSAAPLTPIDQIWAANPTAMTDAWIPGVYVTAISGSGCVTGKACQLFLADATSYADLSAAAHHAIKLFVSTSAATHFVGIAVGDQVNVAAWGFRNTTNGQNELMLQVDDVHRGCAKKIGAGVVQPVAATLSDLGTVQAYEDTYGPVLVQLTGVSANTDATSLSSTTGGLFYPTMFDAGGPSPISVSPFFLPGGAFAGYTTATRYDWQTLTGVFGMFHPSTTTDGGIAPKYLEIYPRTMDDLVKR